MKMSLIPKTHILKAWPEVSGFIENATRTVRQRHDIVDVFEECLEGKQLLWVIFDEENDNRIMGALTTSVVKYPVYTALNIPYMGGKDMMKYRDVIISVLSKFAHDNGFATIECYGRDAWLRVGEKYGFRKAFSVFELDLTQEQRLAAE